MGIDVYLSWVGQTPEEKAAQEDAYLTLDGGGVGYLRESYSGGPYVTTILCREAFESASRAAEIPAAVMRERLTNVTEPARGFDTGHWAVEEIAKQFEAAGAEVQHPGSARTDPMTVEEAVLNRYADQPELASDVIGAVMAFVDLARRKEVATGGVCTIRIAY